MKRKLLSILLLVFFLPGIQLKAQEQEVQQLLLNVEKLAQLKEILQTLKKGYEVVMKGYNGIKQLSEGNFQLHQLFLDGLLEVSPTVKKYRRVAEIVDMQLRLVREYKAGFKRLQSSGQFSVKELGYVKKVHDNLLKSSMRNLDGLVMVITRSELRMSDDERLRLIDQLHTDICGQLSFIRHFNESSTQLAHHRAREQRELDYSKQLQGVK